MAILEPNWQPGDRVLRQFAHAIPAVFLVFCAWRWFQGEPAFAWPWWAATGVIYVVSAFIWPRMVLPVFLLLQVVTWPLGFILSWLILLLIFCFAFTPIGLFMRLIGHDPMQRRGSAASYWQDKEKLAKERFYRLF